MTYPLPSEGEQKKEFEGFDYSIHRVQMPIWCGDRDFEAKEVHQKVSKDLLFTRGIVRKQTITNDKLQH